MTKYKVTSRRVAGRSIGDELTTADLTGVNIDALVAAGHVKLVAEPKPTKKKDSE